MRPLLILCLALAACQADPVLLPDADAPDAGPCGGACGPGTECEGGSCVTVDGGTLDAPVLDIAADRPALVDLGAPDTGSDAGEDVPDVTDAPADAGVDAGPTDVLPAGCTSGTPGNCCGVACPTPAHGTAFCGGGRCDVASCEANYGDCDGMAANGCETDLRVTAAHCGACGAPCGTGRGCVAGACIACAPDTTLCNGTCVDTRTNVAACGACGTRCQARPSSNVSCAASRCVNTCYSGYGDCDGSTVSGCETDLMVSPTNCGRCGNVCPAGARTCTRGRCGS